MESKPSSTNLVISNTYVVAACQNYVAEYIVCSHFSAVQWHFYEISKWTKPLLYQHFHFFSNLPLQFLQNVSKWYILFERITYGIYLCISQSMYKPTLSSCSKNLVKVSVLPVSWECKLHIVITTAVNTIWHTVVTDGL